MKETSKNISNVLAGLNLRYFIECNGISIEDLAESFGIKSDAVNKILDGTNAISGRYNCILVNKYNCDLNFIYGGIPYCDVVMEDKWFENQHSEGKAQEAISRKMEYLAKVVEYIDQL